MIKLVFATGEGGEFSYDGGLPWGGTNGKDMEYFKKVTSDCILVMGRKTFESLPCKLPNRKNIVISKTAYIDDIKAKNGDHPDDVITGSVDIPIMVRHIDKTNKQDICVIGGKDFLIDCFYFADEIYHTIIFGECIGFDLDKMQYLPIGSIPDGYFNTYTSAIHRKDGIEIVSYTDREI